MHPISALDPRYIIMCDYGTRQTCWSWAEALQWLAACGPDAAVFRFGRFVAGRLQLAKLEA